MLILTDLLTDVKISRPSPEIDFKEFVQKLNLKQLEKYGTRI
jgi:hypothetical protein